MSFTIFSDFGCGLLPNEAADLSITVLPYRIKLDKEYEYKLSWENFYQDEFFSLIDKGYTPTYNRPTLGEWLPLVENSFSNDLDILYIGMSGKLTGSYTTLKAISDYLREKYPSRRLITFDTLTVGRAVGYFIKLACSKEREGYSIDYTYDWLTANLGITESYWIPENTSIAKSTRRLSLDKRSTDFYKFPMLCLDSTGAFGFEQPFAIKEDFFNYLNRDTRKKELCITYDFTDEEISSLFSGVPNLSVFPISPCEAAMLGRHSFGIALLKGGCTS